MTAEDDREVFQLVGFERFEPSAFALPIYAATPTANAFRRAVTTIEGYRNAPIEGFDPREPSRNFDRLPRELVRPVRLGDPWLDVLVIDGEVLVGTPSELFVQIGERFDALAHERPLTALEIAAPVPGYDEQKLVEAAGRFVEKRGGATLRRSWALQTYGRDLVMTTGRLVLTSVAATTEEFEAFRRLTIESTRTGALVRLDASLKGLCEGGDLVGTLKNLNRSFQAATGMDGFLLNVVVDGGEEGRSSPTGIAVVPVDDGSARSVHTLFGGRSGSKPIRRLPEAVDFFEPGSGLPDGTGYRAVVVLVTERELRSERSSDWERMKEWVRNCDIDTAVLMPIPPPNGPSSLLVKLDDDATKPFELIIDTSIVRSPEWPVRPNTLEAAQLPELMIWVLRLLAAQSFDRIQNVHGVVSLLPRTSARMEWDSEPLDFATEIVGPSGRDAWRGEVPPPVLSIRPAGSKDRVEVRVGPVRPDFQAFANRCVEAIARRANTKALTAPTEIPTKALKLLEYPEATAGLRIMAGRSSDGEAIRFDLWLTAEVPSLVLCRLAGSEGCHVVRYTDTTTISQLLRAPFGTVPPCTVPYQIVSPGSGEGDDRGPFVRSPTIARQSTIDPDEWEDWAEAADVDHRIARPIWMNAHPRDGRVVLDPAFVPELRRLAVSKPLARGVAEHVRIGDGNIAEQVGKLSSQWEGPPEGFVRIAMRDGVRRPWPRVVPDGTVLGPRWWYLDATPDVAGILASRPFDLWLRLYSGRVDDRHSRPFRRSALNGFPWPGGTRYEYRGGEKPPIVTFDDERVAATFRPVNYENDDRGASLVRTKMRNEDGIRLARLDEAVLSAYELNPRCSDVDIVDALLARCGALLGTF